MGSREGYRPKSSERSLGDNREGKTWGMEFVVHWEGSWQTLKTRSPGSLMD